MNQTELKKEVASLVLQTEKTHRYSMSKIYGLYNKVFEKNETPQSCASCLIRKVQELKNWLETESCDEERTERPIKKRSKNNDNTKK